MYKIKRHPNIDWEAMADHLGYDDWKVMLEKKYHEHKSSYSLAEEMGVSPMCMWYTLRHIGVELIYKNNNKFHRFKMPFLKLAKRKDLSKLCATEIADIIGCSNSNVHLLSKTTGIEIRKLTASKSKKDRSKCSSVKQNHQSPLQHLTAQGIL